jgi:hypothetical protein
LEIGTNLQRDLSMQVASVQSAITVEAQTPVINTTSSEVSGVITE